MCNKSFTGAVTVSKKNRKPLVAQLSVLWHAPSGWTCGRADMWVVPSPPLSSSPSPPRRHLWLHQEGKEKGTSASRGSGANLRLRRPNDLHEDDDLLQQQSSDSCLTSAATAAAACGSNPKEKKKKNIDVPLSKSLNLRLDKMRLAAMRGTPAHQQSKRQSK